MASKDIINHIRHFFKTAAEKTLAEVKAAASVEIEGDITIEEYISGFCNEYFYTREYEANCYVADNMQLSLYARQYSDSEFEEALSHYGQTDLDITINLESGNNGKVLKMVKEAA